MFEQSQSTQFPAFLDIYTDPNTFGLDFASFHSPADIAAPSIDSFEYDLDLLTKDHDLCLEVHQVNSAYSHTIPTCGPGSAITSESSAQDSLSYYSESFSSPPSNYSFCIDDMDFQQIRVDDYSSAQSNLSVMDTAGDPTSFGALPPTPPRSPAAPLPNVGKTFGSRTSFSDYSPPKRRSISSDYYSQSGYNMAIASTVSPSHISNTLSVIASTPRGVDEYKGDPRKKYKCTACPRAFARAYNLKTHMATHDPNRLKPHVCPHSSCGRSFSRKHDLGRHLISIHRDESDGTSHHSASSKVSIGVEKGPRGWCDTCGKGFVGRTSTCGCHDVK
ncbi:hypothetical protein Hypma_015208 [Hypsizygus marmoreus]|uniref:C2H2-type domain-containing protein n=1 Tax=Hypsizygus marmoreus TaxID=39966 RepID=A0A369KC92_HYPMA|nr:hypothetical protein Hypma_015208 [Hypsizygus marmoreus]